MKRRIVCRNEAAGHPLRRMMPPPTLLAAIAQSDLNWWKREETHLFCLSFFAFFVAIYTFIA